MHESSQRLIVLGLVISVVVSLAGCFRPEPLRVGFVAQLSGVGAELGDQERNGAQLAVEEINAAGGVAGRQIDLIVKDDLGTREGAQAADRELVSSGAVAIIGHATSEQTIAGLAVTDPAHVLMLSPTASTPELSGRVDYFFRVAQALVLPREFARRIGADRRLQRISVIYDKDNRAYSEGYLRAFLDAYQSRGDMSVAHVSFSSKAKPDFTPLVAQLRASRPDGLLIIASDIDTALIAQRTRLLGWMIPMFTTAWAQTQTLIDNGGRALEGMEIELASSYTSQTPRCLEFKTHYQARFGLTPSFGAVFSYEATEVLAVALKSTGGKAKGLPQALVSIKDFQGLGDTLSFDRYGDVRRPIHFGVIRNGRFVGIG